MLYLFSTQLRVYLKSPPRLYQIRSGQGLPGMGFVYSHRQDVLWPSHWSTYQRLVFHYPCASNVIDAYSFFFVIFGGFDPLMLWSQIRSLKASRIYIPLQWDVVLPIMNAILKIMACLHMNHGGYTPYSFVTFLTKWQNWRETYTAAIKISKNNCNTMQEKKICKCSYTVKLDIYVMDMHYKIRNLYQYQLRKPYLWKTANMSLKTCLVIKQMQSTQTDPNNTSG